MGAAIEPEESSDLSQRHRTSLKYHHEPASVGRPYASIAHSMATGLLPSERWLKHAEFEHNLEILVT